jgi:outer membrane lipoprotein-sorting protein
MHAQDSYGGQNLNFRRFEVCLAVFLAATLLFAFGWQTEAQNHSPLNLESALRHLDSAAHDFHSLSADVERTKVPSS